MSGGRFLVGLTEVMRSESIISFKTILKNELRVQELTSSDEFEDEKVSKLISEARFEDHDHFDFERYRRSYHLCCRIYFLFFAKKVSCTECYRKAEAGSCDQ